MDNAIFIGSCLIIGGVVLVQIPFNVRTVDNTVIGKLLYIFIMLSLGDFLLSLGGTGIAIAANSPSTAFIVEGAANVTGLALLGSGVIVSLYSLAHYLIRRGRASSEPQ